MSSNEDTPKIVDHRQTPKSELLALLTKELQSQPLSMLWTARRPRKNWFSELSKYHALVMASSAEFEQILWIHPSASLTVPAEVQKEHEYLLGTYKELFFGEAPLDSCPHWNRYKTTLLQHIASEEQTHFPELIRALPLERAIRELGYEHQGLKRGLERLPAIAKAARSGDLSSKERELFDLDYYHLLEHHLERERTAIWPAISFLKSIDRWKTTCYNSSHRPDPT